MWRLLLLMLIAWRADCQNPSPRISLYPPDFIDYSIKFVDVDANSVTFEIVDDNVTTINYFISYSLRHQGDEYDADQKIDTESFTRSDSLKKRTNVRKLKTKDNQTYLDDDLNHGATTNETKEQLSEQERRELHRFIIGQLEPDRIYSVFIDVTATESYLKPILENSKLPKRTTAKNFTFNIKTTYNPMQAAYEACNYSLAVQSGDASRDETRGTSGDEVTQHFADAKYSSCYVANSKCGQCKTTCYQIDYDERASAKSFDMSKFGNLAGLKPKLCKPCACDRSKSNGECRLVDPRQERIECTRCLEPYAGPMCLQCKNDGVDYYRTTEGTCEKCDCNMNSEYDVYYNGVNNQNSKRRRCEAVTGRCINCMYNTTGSHCHVCRPGFQGEAVHRTCKPVESKTLFLYLSLLFYNFFS